MTTRRFGFLGPAGTFCEMALDAWAPAELSSTLRNYFAGRDPERGFSATELMSQG